MKIANPNFVTQKQVEYIKILLIDTGLDDRQYKYIDTLLGYSINNDIWSLTKAEASTVINDLQRIKAQL